MIAPWIFHIMNVKPCEMLCERFDMHGMADEA